MKQAALILAIFSTILLETNAQPYQSIFGKDSTEWVINWYNLDDFDNYASIYTEKDTVVNGYTYKKVVIKYFTPSDYDGLFREDTITGKVWYRPLFLLPHEDTAAILAFDFSLEVGDSFDISNMTLGHMPFYSTVDSVKYLNGLKHIYFDAQYSWAPHPPEYPSEPFTIIEGIGGNMGPLWKQYNGELRGHYLMCSYKDGERTSYENIRYSGLCPKVWSEINKVENEPHPALTIYPNPVNKFFKIKGTESQKVLQVDMFDNSGHLIESIQNFKDQPVDVSGLPNGLYFLKILLEHKETSHSYFIIHH